MTKSIILRVAKLFAGLFLYAVGIVMTINANLGLAPWEVFHQGISKTVGITMGQASIAMGFVLIVLNGFFGEKLGWGTLSNMLFIGIFMDILMLNNLIPVFPGFFPGLLMLLTGIFVIGIATVFYMGAGFGSGPRDGLMVALKKRTGKSIRFIRNSMEITVLIMGYLLGGFVGAGTLITSITVGYIVQFAFRLFKFDATDVENRFIYEDINYIKNLIKEKKDSSSEENL